MIKIVKALVTKGWIAKEIGDPSKLLTNTYTLDLTRLGIESLQDLDIPSPTISLNELIGYIKKKTKDLLVYKTERDVVGGYVNVIKEKDENTGKETCYFVKHPKEKSLMVELLSRYSSGGLRLHHIGLPFGGEDNRVRTLAQFA